MVASSPVPAATSPPPGASGDRPPARRVPLSVAAAAACLAAGLFLAATSSRSTLWDRDEALYAQAAVEMRASGELLVATFGGRPWPHKPPLVTWLMAAALGLPVPAEVAVRLPSAAGLAAAGWFTFRLGAALFDLAQRPVQPARAAKLTRNLELLLPKLEGSKAPAVKEEAHLLRWPYMLARDLHG